MQVFALYSLVSFHTGCSKHLRRVELTSPLWDASDEIADPVTWCQHLLERWGICHFQAILGHSRVGGLGKESACQCRRHGFDPWSRKISWRRKWQPTPVFLPGKFHGQGSLAGYSLWGHKESDMTEHTRTEAYVRSFTSYTHIYNYIYVYIYIDTNLSKL